LLREALQRAVGAGHINESDHEAAFVAAYFRSEAEIRSAVAAVPSLEVVEVAETTIPVAQGLGRASGAMGDLAWSIFAASLAASSSGLTPAKLECIRHHMDAVLDESFSPDEGALHTYLMVAVRRKPDPDPDEELGVFME
jgi:hypothetical protein